MKTYYRVQPLCDPKPTGKMLAFIGIEYVLAYVLGWYGDTCTIWKVEGDVTIEQHTEDVQLFMQSDPQENEATFTHLTVPVIQLNIKEATRVGVVQLIKSEENVLLIDISIP